MNTAGSAIIPTPQKTIGNQSYLESFDTGMRQIISAQSYTIGEVVARLSPVLMQEPQTAMVDKVQSDCPYPSTGFILGDTHSALMLLLQENNFQLQKLLERIMI